MSLKTVLNWEASFKCKLEKELTSRKDVKVKCVICAKYESQIKNIKGFSTSWITGMSSVKKRQLTGNVQFIFFCKPPKSLVNVCLRKILKSTVTKTVIKYFHNFGEETLKSSSFCNISNFNNGLVWNPSKVQRSLYEGVARFL